MAILFLWGCCLIAILMVLIRMLSSRRRIEASVVVVASAVGGAAVFLPVGPKVWPVLAVLGLCTAGLSLLSLILEWRVAVLVFGLVFPLVGALTLTSMPFPLFVAALSEIVLVCMPFLFVLSAVFLTGALVRRQSGGSI